MCVRCGDGWVALVKPSVCVGIDIGSTRVRAAVTRRGRRGARVEAIAVRELPAGACVGGAIREPHLVAALLEEMRAELPWKGRACVCAVGLPAATLRAATFPRMSPAERSAAARLDAERGSEGSPREAIVRVRPLPGSQAYGVGLVDRRVLHSRVNALRDAGLRVEAVDYDALALLRCYPAADAVLDVGLARSVLHVRDGAIAESWWTPLGGASITAEIARDLAIDEREAETRKRIHGSAMSADAAVSALSWEVRSLLEAARRRRSVEKLAVVGNASRLRGFRRQIADMPRVSVFADPSGAVELCNVPDDVARAGMPDWSVAIGLSLWNA